MTEFVDNCKKYQFHVDTWFAEAKFDKLQKYIWTKLVIEETPRIEETTEFYIFV